MKFSIKDFFSKCDQIRRKLRISSHLLKKSLMGNFIFCCSVCIKRFIIQWRSNVRTDMGSTHKKECVVIACSLSCT